MSNILVYTFHSSMYLSLPDVLFSLGTPSKGMTEERLFHLCLSIHHPFALYNPQLPHLSLSPIRIFLHYSPTSGIAVLPLQPYKNYYSKFFRSLYFLPRSYIFKA